MLLVNVFFLFLIFEIHCVRVAKPAINKCCSMGEYVTIHDKIPFKRCESLNMSNFNKVIIYNKNYKVTNESVETVFEIVPEKFSDEKFKRQSVDLTRHNPSYNFYLTKKSILVLEIPNIYDRFQPINNDHFCYDYTKNEHAEIVPRFWVYFEEEPKPKDASFLTTAMLVSSVFLLIVLIVYALLPELRNLCGLILMAYVSSLLGGFVLLATIRIDIFSKKMCINLTCATYFFLLATFCWMNVMSYDIWWTFRSYAKVRPIYRRGDLFKFAMYSIYGYGVPLAMSVFLRVINDVDLTHMPWFIKPNIPQLGCFIRGGQKLVYLYIPMMILILSNWMFYLMTAVNVWRLRRGTAVLDSAAAGTPATHRTHKQRFLVYLKLSVVMGLSWVLEVVSFLVPSLKILWWISDVYNLLVGIIIFVIFVFKRKILKQLVKVLKPQNFKKCVRHSSIASHSSVEDNSTNQETQTMQVCADSNNSVTQNL